jgi:hypothetical protein
MLSVQPLQNQGTITGVSTLPKPQPLAVAKPTAQPSIKVSQPVQQQPISVQPLANKGQISSVGTATEQQPFSPKVSLDEFAQTIKAKYPQYSNKDNITLAKAIIEKYPQYADKIYVQQEEKPGFIKGVVQNIARTPVQVAKAGIGLIDLIGSKLTSDEERKAMLEQRGREMIESPTFGQTEDYSLKSGIGKGFELGSYAIGGGGVKNLVQSGVKGAIKESAIAGAKAGLGQGLASGFGAGLQKKDANTGSVAIDTLAGGLLGAIFGGALGGATGAIGYGVKKGVGELSSQLKVNNLKNDLFSAIDKGINKGVKPSVAGKASLAGQKTFTDKARQAVAVILDNKKALNFVDDGVPTNRLPKTAQEFLDAIGQVKKQIFSKYDFLQKFTGKAGGKVDLADIADDLERIAQDPKIKDVSPQASRYALERAAALRERGNYDTQSAQDVIQSFNQKLKAFYQNPNPNDSTATYVDSFIANKLRSKMDDLIANVADPNYQILKNQYGALSSIEKDVAKRAIVQGRKAPAGLLDFTDIFSAGDVINGIASFNPALIAKGGVQKVISSTLKKLNDPDRAIAGMFKDSDKIFEQIKKAGLEINQKPAPNFMQRLSSPNPVKPKASVNVPMSMPRRIQPLEINLGQKRPEYLQ